MRAKNKIVSGFLKEYQFTKKYGQLYLKCLEQEYAVNRMTVKSIQVLDYQEIPSLSNILVKGFILSKIFGLLGMIAGTATAKKNCVYRVKLTFPNDEVGLAEIDAKYYELLVRELFDTL
jgi:hypothetical protein